MKRSLLLASLVASLAMCGTPTATHPDAGLLVDQGLESVVLATSPTSGWYSEAARDGRVFVARDDAEYFEGTSSMRVEVLRPTTDHEGHPSISQVVQLPRGSSHEVELSVRLRGSAPGHVTLSAYVWDGDVARLVVQQEVPVHSSWTRTSLRFGVPSDRDQVGLFIYVPAGAGAQTWIDDARLEVVEG